MRLRLAALVLALACGSAAGAEEPMSTAGAAAPLPQAAEPAPVATTASTPSQDREAREIGDWAQGVLAGRPAEIPAEAAAGGRCPPSDGKPHGEVWAGIGTRGYREVGGVVTQRVGDCGSVTLGVSHTEGRFGRHR